MSPRDYVIILDELITATKKENLDRMIGVFVDLLRKNNDLSLGDKIIEEFENYQKEKEGIRKIKVTTARPLAKEIKKELEKLGEVEEKKDPFLIGGIKIRVGDTLIDGSLKNSLENLRNVLSK